MTDIRRRFVFIVPIFLLVLFAGANCAAQTGVTSGSIRSSFKGSDIVMTASAAFGGAIYSLKWNDVEFLESADFGGELQSTAALDGFGERCNPSEVGSYHDSMPSKLTGMWIEQGGTVMRTTSIMRYAYPTRKECGNDPVGFRKTVTIGYGGMPNVAEHTVVFSLPKDYARDLSKWPTYHHATFMALSANLPLARFPKQYFYDPTTKNLISIPDTKRNSAQRFPPIIATADGKYALGGYSRGAPAKQGGDLVYSQWRSTERDPGAVSPLNEWICRYNHKAAIKAGDYEFKCYTIVGTLEDVKEGIDRLYALTKPPTVSFASPADGATLSGTVTLTANAHDDIKIVGVTFMDGDKIIDKEIWTPPYTTSWDTKQHAANGTHTLRAVARNGGLKTTTSTVTVTVANGVR